MHFAYCIALKLVGSEFYSTSPMTINLLQFFAFVGCSAQNKYGVYNLELWV